MKAIPFTLVLLSILSTFFACSKQTDFSTNAEETFYIRNGGSDMAVFAKGNISSKKLIVVLHGGPGDGGLNYANNNYAQQLEEKYGMIYFDQRHQGNSHGHLPSAEISLDSMVEDVHLLVQTLKQKYGAEIQVYLFAHSWGGMLGTAFLTTKDYQYQIDGFIKVSSSYDIPLVIKETHAFLTQTGTNEIAADRNIAFWQEVLNFAATLDTNVISIEDGLKLNAYGGRISSSSENLLDDEFVIPSQQTYPTRSNYTNNEVTTTMNAIGLFIEDSFITEIFNTSLTERLEQITIPVLIIAGKYDFKVPPTVSELAFNKISSSEKYLKIYPHSNHNPMKADADRFVRDVGEFID